MSFALKAALLFELCVEWNAVVVLFRDKYYHLIQMKLFNELIRFLRLFTLTVYDVVNIDSVVIFAKLRNIKQN